MTAVIASPLVDALEPTAWPLSRTAEALQMLARRSGFPLSQNAAAAPPGAALRDPATFAQWVDAAAAWLGLEAEPVETPHAEVRELLRRAAPALIRISGRNQLLVLVRGKRRSVKVLAPDLTERDVPIEVARRALCGPMEAPIQAEIDAWLGPLLGDGANARRARDALVRERLTTTQIRDVWVVRPPAGASLVAQARSDHLFGRAAVLMLAHVATSLLGIGAWAMLGRGALDGRLERAWLFAWAIVLFTSIPFRLLGLWAQGQVAIGLGKLMKRRLLGGALRIDPEIIRHQGSGQLLGRTLEASAIETLALGAGFASLLALIELVFGMLVLSAGGGGAAHAALLGVVVLFTLGLGWKNYRATLRCTEHQRAMTNDLVEQMAGHRTRLAQQPPSRWHEGEDEMLEEYLVRSRAKDRIDALLFLLPRMWLILGVAGLAPTFVLGGSSAALAIGVGGVLLGAQALAVLSTGLGQIAAAAAAWKQVSLLFDAACKPVVAPSPSYAVVADGVAPGPAAASRTKPPLVDAMDLVFAYPGRPQPVIQDGTMRIEAGDRVLLEGASGGGKSTLASLITGLRQPASGLLLLDGLDWHTLGPDGWRRRVVGAPQFQENHVLTDTFAFNLLMGRGWPPTSADVNEAEEVCKALGLGELLTRMPAGLMQMVGDSGWRLSHGERSRMFIARALLQRASLIVLDESFAALDPKTLERCLRCVLDRAPTLFVIAHP